MKIVIHDYSGHPFQIQLSRELASKGYEVIHIYSQSIQTPKGELVKRETDSPNLKIIGIDLLEEFKKYNFLKRRSQEIKYGRILAEKIESLRPDIVISGNTPLDIQKLLLKKCKGVKSKFIFWVQDIYGIAIDKLLGKKLPLLGKIIGSYYIGLERKLLKLSDGIIIISEDFMPYVDYNDHIYVIENWAPLESITVMSKDNDWAKKNNLENKRCIVYAGTLGMKHNPSILLRLAEYFKDNEDIRVLVISEGKGADWLKSKKEKKGLDNLIIMEFQPFKELSRVLATADLLVAILEEVAGIFSVPSKILTYMCTRRPILLSVPEDNLSSKIIKENNAGLVSKPGDIDNFLNNARKIIESSDLQEIYSQNARKYAEKKFNIDFVSNKFIAVLEDIMDSPQGIKNSL